jgi:hypothetical protein
VVAASLVQAIHQLLALVNEFFCVFNGAPGIVISFAGIAESLLVESLENRGLRRALVLMDIHNREI